MIPRYVRVVFPYRLSRLIRRFCDTLSSITPLGVHTMTLPKKNRREISVDSVDFHWTIGGRIDHRRGTATVQHASGSGAKLIIDPIGVLRPNDVAASIRFAITNAWQPASSGPDFWIGFDEECAPQDQFVLLKESDEPYWKIAHGRTT